MVNSVLEKSDNFGPNAIHLSYPHFGPFFAPWKPASLALLFPQGSGDSETDNTLNKEKGWIAYINDAIIEVSGNLLRRKKNDLGMKRTVLTAAMMIAGMGALQAQQQETYFKGQNRRDMILSLVSSQYTDGGINKPATNVKPADLVPIIPGTKTQVTEGSATIVKGAPSAVVNSTTILGEDKYIKAKEDGKRYDEFQVFDIKGLDKDHVVLGMLTSTLERAIRYDDKGDLDKKVYLSTGYVDQVDENGQKIEGSKIQISSIRLNDKLFVIIGEKDYRYIDGKKLVGDQRLVDQMLKGKPVTEITFFYELQKAGIIGKDMSVTQFAKMNLHQKQSLLNDGALAADF